MARKTVLVCDNCGAEVEEGKGAMMRVTFNDARRGAKAADLCDGCAGTMPGNAVARRGRKPKSPRSLHASGQGRLQPLLRAARSCRTLRRCVPA